jgi:hypothetical protein
MQPGPPLASAVGEATEAGTEPGCSPDMGDRRSWGGRAHARRVVAAVVETAVYDSGRPTSQKRRPAAAGPTDAPGSHDVRRHETQPRVGGSCGHGQETEAARGSRRGTYPSAKVAGTAHLTHPRPVVPTAAGVWSSNAGYHPTITPRPCAANVQPSRIMPDHQLLRSCFLTVYPGDE